MKTILFFVTIYFFARRIKNTHLSFSKKLRQEKYEKCANNVKEVITKHPEQVQIYKGVTYALTIILGLALMTYYYQMGKIISKNMLFSVLTVTQLILTVLGMYPLKFSDIAEDYKRSPLLFIVNAIVDYIYYPLALYYFIFVL